MTLVKVEMRLFGIHPTWIEKVCKHGVDHAEKWFSTAQRVPEWKEMITRPLAAYSGSEPE